MKSFVRAALVGSAFIFGLLITCHYNVDSSYSNLSINFGQIFHKVDTTSTVKFIEEVTSMPTSEYCDFFIQLCTSCTLVKSDCKFEIEPGSAEVFKQASVRLVKLTGGWASIVITHNHNYRRLVIKGPSYLKKVALLLIVASKAVGV